MVVLNLPCGVDQNPTLHCKAVREKESAVVEFTPPTPTLWGRSKPYIVRQPEKESAAVLSLHCGVDQNPTL